MPRRKFMYAKKKSRAPIIKMLFTIMILTIVCIAILYGYQRYHVPPLEGQWVSMETGEWIDFNKDGTVSIANQTYPITYELTAPNTMIYYVDDKRFEMAYSLEGRTLKWGVKNQQMELFERKSH